MFTTDNTIHLSSLLLNKYDHSGGLNICLCFLPSSDFFLAMLQHSEISAINLVNRNNGQTNEKLQLVIKWIFPLIQPKVKGTYNNPDMLKTSLKRTYIKTISDFLLFLFSSISLQLGLFHIALNTC